MYLTVAFFSMNNLNWGEKIKEFLDKAAILIATVYVIKAVTMLVNYIVVDILAKKEADETRLKSIKGLMVLIKVIIWVIGIIMLLDNMGYKVSTVVTGLGIGGIAVALAAQAVLGDLFSYISIIFDRPFQLGDVIVSGDVTGTVENIGIKTTRIRSVWGEEIILSNSQLTGSKIQNLKRMENRRVLFALGVTYDTPVEVLKGIPESIKEIIDGVKETKFDRAHFRSFGDFSLNFEVVYTVLNPDYTRYMDIQQEINFKIAEKFATQKIEFAYPTQTLQIKK